MHNMNSTTSAASARSEGDSPAQLSDADLLVTTRLLVGRSNELLAALLAHLAEIEARGLHRTRACSGLYPFCIYELRLSEDEAYRRVTASRLVRRFPALLEAIATGELHLTGLLMLGPHLTENNLVEVLARAKHRTKKEIARLVRLLDPLPEVRPRIEPLGPTPGLVIPEAPRWRAFVQSTRPVRELTPGDRPRDWVEKGAESANDVADAYRLKVALCSDSQERAQLGEARPDVPASDALAPQRYSVQFTAGEEYVKLVEEARALLSHSALHTPLDELHLQAMREFVRALKRRKYAVTKRPPKGSSNKRRSAERAIESNETTASSEVDRSRPEPDHARDFEHPRRRGRYVPAAVRRAVFDRDEGRCTYHDASGQRCCETHLLELHHELAFARGGAHTQENLTLRCQAHNTLAAEEEFGRDWVEIKRESSEHEPWRRRGDR